MVINLNYHWYGIIEKDIQKKRKKRQEI